MMGLEKIATVLFLCAMLYNAAPRHNIPFMPFGEGHGLYAVVAPMEEEV